MAYYNQHNPSPYGTLPPYATPATPTDYPPGTTTAPPGIAHAAPYPPVYAAPQPQGYPPPQSYAPPSYYPAQPQNYHHASYPPQHSQPAPQMAFYPPQSAHSTHSAWNHHHGPPPAAVAPPGYAAQMAQPPHVYQTPQTAAVPLDPYGIPIVPADRVVQGPTQYRVGEKVLSVTRDSFFIKDMLGVTRYNVEGLISIHERKILKDVNGQTLLKLREARLRLRDKISIFDANNNPILTLHKASAIQFGEKRVNGYIGAQMGGTPALVITGNRYNTHFRIMNQQGRQLADVRRRKFSLKNVLTDQDTYDVTVNVGSPALICFLTVAIDEIYED